MAIIMVFLCLTLQTYFAISNAKEANRLQKQLRETYDVLNSMNYKDRTVATLSVGWTAPTIEDEKKLERLQQLAKEYEV